MPPRPRPTTHNQKGPKENLAAGSSLQGEESGTLEEESYPQVIERDNGDVVLQEGDEEAMYIYLDLSEMPGSTSLSNTEVEIKGLDTDKPEIKFQDGTSMEGTYSSTLGSQLFFKVDGNQQQHLGVATQEEPSLQFVGLSEKTVVFQNKQDAATTEPK